MYFWWHWLSFEDELLLKCWNLFKRISYALVRQGEPGHWKQIYMFFGKKWRFFNLS